MAGLFAEDVLMLGAQVNDGYQVSIIEENSPVSNLLERSASSIPTTKVFLQINLLARR
jgi:hypothetical protein